MQSDARLPSVPKKLPVVACCPTDGRRVPGGAAGRARAVPVFRALADATRVEILALIAARPEPVCVCDIVTRFELRQPTISHHLKVLREAGLVTVSRRGTWAYYAIDPHGVRTVRAVVDLVLPEGAAG